jgi:hypothetical protein
MFIFNTTFLVSDKAHGTWTKWVRENYIPFVLKSELLTQPQVTKILSAEEQDGTSFSVQFRAADAKILEIWRKQYENECQINCFKEFGTEVLSFSTVMEIIL